jgi:hypothetical protein
MVAAVLGLLVGSGCASSYQPARNPRVTASGGETGPNFFKDGKEYSGGFFGGGLVDAVHGNERAEQEAITARNLTVAGFTLQVVGLSGVVTGVVLETRDDDAARTAGIWFGLGGAVTVLVGTLLVRSGSPHMYNAVNIYNDGVEGHPLPPKPLDESLRPGEEIVLVSRLRSVR